MEDFQGRISFVKKLLGLDVKDSSPKQISVPQTHQHCLCNAAGFYDLQHFILGITEIFRHKPAAI